MSSLKGYTVALARHLASTPAALYERQRALVRAGLLDLGDGRGPGSGVRATAPSVAMLVLSILATDRLTESEERVRALASARPPRGERCPLTRMSTFLDAFAAVLATTGAAAGVTEIVVSRTADRALIRYWADDGTVAASEFTGPRLIEPGISVFASISGNLLGQIAADVQAIILEGFNRSEERA